MLRAIFFIYVIPISTSVLLSMALLCADIDEYSKGYFVGCWLLLCQMLCRDYLNKNKC